MTTLATTRSRSAKGTGHRSDSTHATWRGALQDVAWTTALTTCLLALLIGDSWDRLGNPLRAGGDPLAVAAAGSSLDWSNHAFGYPFGMTVLPYFPTLDGVQLAMADAISRFTDNPYLPANIVWLLSYPLTAVAAWWVLRLVGASRTPAVVLAVSYAFIPYHSVRALTHIYLATSWSAVLAVGLALLVGMDRIPPLRDARRHGQRGTLIAVVAVALVVAYSGIYYAYFALLLVGVALLWRFATGSGLRSMIHTSYPALLLFLFMLMGLLVQALANSLDPPAAPVVDRNAGNSAVFAGNLAMALTPSPRSDIPLVSTLTGRSAGFLYENEGFTYGQFGSVITTACAALFLLGMLVLSHRAATIEASTATARRPRPSSLVLALVSGSVLFFSPWTLNFLFALYISPGIRSWNRLLPVILLLFLCGAVTVLRELQLPNTRRSGPALAVAILVVTLFDGVTPYRALIGSALSRSERKVMAAERYAAAVNQVSKPPCGILQLPYVPYPEGPPQHHMEDYEHFLVALANPDKYWSYGGVKKTSASLWAERLQSSVSPTAVDSLREAGFCGVHVDLRGYDPAEREEVLTAVQATLGPPKTTGFRGKWLYFAIEGTRTTDPESFDVSGLSPTTQRFFSTR